MPPQNRNNEPANNNQPGGTPPAAQGQNITHPPALSAQPGIPAQDSGDLNSASQKRPAKSIKLILAVVAAVVVGLIAYYAYGAFKPFPMETYSNEELGFSILYPKEFKVEDDAFSSASFQEDDDESTRSSIDVHRQTSPGNNIDKEEFLSAIEEIGEQSIGSAASQGQEFSLNTKERRQINGLDAVYISGDIKEDGALVGKMYAAYVYVDENTVYSILVAVHSSDDRFAREAESIISSFSVE